jgi:hypothetical protein
MIQSSNRLCTKQYDISFMPQNGTANAFSKATLPICSGDFYLVILIASFQELLHLNACIYRLDWFSPQTNPQPDTPRLWQLPLSSQLC